MFGPTKSEGQAASQGVHLVAIRLAGRRSGPEDIVELIWVSPNFKSGRCSTNSMVEYIDNGRFAKVSDGRLEWAVEIVRPDDRAPYLRTSSDDTYQDKLLALPQFD
jgi:hypothetical protein